MLGYVYCYRIVYMCKHLFTVQQIVQQKLIRCVILHFQDWRDTASLRNRNRAKITVFKCEQKPYRVCISCPRKSFSV